MVGVRIHEGDRQASPPVFDYRPLFSGKSSSGSGDVLPGQGPSPGVKSITGNGPKQPNMLGEANEKVGWREAQPSALRDRGAFGNQGTGRHPDPSGGRCRSARGFCGRRKVPSPVPPADCYYGRCRALNGVELWRCTTPVAASRSMKRSLDPSGGCAPWSLDQGGSG
jgi:hypothetical protein